MLIYLYTVVKCVISKSKKVFPCGTWSNNLDRLYWLTRENPITVFQFKIICPDPFYIHESKVFLHYDIFQLITPDIRILDFDWCLFRIISYLGLISFIFTVFAWGFNFFPSAPWYLRKRLLAWEIFRLWTGIFRKYPSHTWYICSIFHIKPLIFKTFLFNCHVFIWNI